MKSRVMRAAVAALVAGAMGCGGGANNDAGTGFTLVGFTQVNNNTCSTNQYISVGVMPITEGTAQEQGLGFPGVLNVCFQVENNLLTQAVRTDRAMIRYYVSGGSAQPPTTVTGAAGFLSAASGNTALPPGAVLPSGGVQAGVQPGTKPQGTLPSGSIGGATGSGTTGGGTASGNTRFTGAFTIVPAPIAEWISAHRSELPPPPFEMIASVQISGVTSSGNRIETNEAGLTIVVTEDNLL